MLSFDKKIETKKNTFTNSHLGFGVVQSWKGIKFKHENCFAKYLLRKNKQPMKGLSYIFFLYSAIRL